MICGSTVVVFSDMIGVSGRRGMGVVNGILASLGREGLSLSTEV